jgi:hypothetical protein
MKTEGPLLPEHKTMMAVDANTPLRRDGSVIFTRDHEVIRRWAGRRGAEPATGEATRSGPATAHVSDGGAGVRFNFPAAARFRPISWEEWLEHFDRHELAFVFDNDDEDGTVSNRYRIVRADDWKEFTR